MAITTKIQVEIDMPEIVDAVIKQLSSDGTLVAVVRCWECVHRDGKDGQCPLQWSGDPYIDMEPKDDFYCANADRRPDE